MKLFARLFILFLVLVVIMIIIIVASFVLSVIERTSVEMASTCEKSLSTTGVVRDVYMYLELRDIVAGAVDVGITIAIVAALIAVFIYSRRR